MHLIAYLIDTVVVKKEWTTMLVILLTKSFIPFWPPLYDWRRRRRKSWWKWQTYISTRSYSGAQKGRNDFVSKITNKVVSSFLATTVFHHYELRLFAHILLDIDLSPIAFKENESFIHQCTYHSLLLHVLFCLLFSEFFVKWQWEGMT